MAFFSRDLLNLQRNVEAMFNSMRNQYLGGDIGASSLLAPTLMDIDDMALLAPPSSLLLPGGDAFPSKDPSALQQTQDQSGGQQLQQQGGAGTLFLPAWNQLSQMNLDVHATPQAYTVTCDLPGVEKSSIDIQADQRTRQLTISAERRSEYVERDTQEQPQSQGDTKQSGTGSSGPPRSGESSGSTEKTDQQVATSQQQAVSTNTRPRIVRQERFYGKTQRTVRLAQDADLEHVEAKYENGVLKLNVPRKERQPEKDRYKKVEVM